jgi:shikimate kinase
MNAPASRVAALTRPLDRPVVLVGLMGAGKTAVGRRLAARLGLRFADADHEIEAAAGRSVAAIFAELGEPAFRDGERRVIARLLDAGPGVIATGGGAFIDPQTRAAVKERAVSIWLRADVDLLVKRTARSSRRPLLKRGDPHAILTDLAAQRNPIYAEADLIVDSVDVSPERMVDRVLTALNEHVDGIR